MIKSKLPLFVLSVVIILLCSSWTERNLFTVWIKSHHTIFVKGKIADITELKDLAKIYIANPNNEEWLPESKEKRVKYFGVTKISKTVVSLQTDREVTYGFYISVQNELQKAYNELREELAQKRFDTSYNALSAQKQKAIKTIYPIRISEAEPNWMRNKDGELIKNNHWYLW